MATELMAVGVLADMLAANRSLLEDIRARELLRGSTSTSRRGNPDPVKLSDAA